MHCTWLGYRLSGCIEQHKTWPTFRTFSTNLHYYTFLDCCVLYYDLPLCSALHCSTLYSSVLECIVRGWGTDYQAALNNKIHFCSPHNCSALYCNVLGFSAFNALPLPTMWLTRANLIAWVHLGKLKLTASNLTTTKNSYTSKYHLNFWAMT